MLDQLTISMVTAVFIGAIAGYVGSLMITRRMALVSGPLGHLALPGVALALLMNFNVFVGAIISILFGALLIWIFSLRSKAHLEALTAVVFTSTVALGFLLLPLKHAEEALIGDITKVSFWDMLVAIVLSVSLFVVIKKIYPKMILAEISEDLAKSMKVNVKKYELIYMFSVALVAALEVKIVGTLLTVAMIAVPAATSINVSRNLKQYSLLALTIGAVSSYAGVLAFNLLHVPAGPMIILTNFVIFVLSLVFVKR